MRPPSAVVLIVAISVSSACEVTWREPEVQPLNPVSIFATELVRTCSGLAEAMRSLGTTLAEQIVEADACLLETRQVELAGSGAPIEHLDEVAYVGNQSFMRSGRYVATASVRPTSAGNTRVRLTVRVEGYDGGAYRLLRSRGLVERTVIERLSDLLDAEPLEVESPN